MNEDTFTENIFFPLFFEKGNKRIDAGQRKSTLLGRNKGTEKSNKIRVVQQQQQTTKNWARHR